jgi:5-methylcytosine-specific restriction protein B
MAKKKLPPTAAPSYFDIAALQNISSQFGTLYDKNSKGAAWFKDTAIKLKYLVEILALSPSKAFYIVYKELPQNNARPPKLKTYVLVGFSTKEGEKQLFIKIEIRGLETSNPKFIIEFDKNRKDTNFNPYDAFLSSAACSNSKYEIPFDHTFPQNWNNLVNQIKTHIASMVTELDSHLNPPGGAPPVNGGLQNLPTDGARFNLNTILYGPPGTGKTFHSITHAVAIIDEQNPEALIVQSQTEEGRQTLKKRYDELVASGNIVFTTFHQSLGYEDFIEGIKPLEPSPGLPMQYDVIDGIFKRICSKAEERWAITDTAGPSFEDVLEKLEADWRLNPTMSFELTREGNAFTLIEFKTKNIPFKKASGGTSHSISKKTLKDLYLGIREKYPSGLKIYYESILGKLKDLASTMPQSDVDQQEKRSKFVLIIDEINRGNVSQIFGELITLIEPDKRINAKEEISVTLPYSGDEFGVPQNVYIIGTMNTADRSVEALDTALRRRFSFVPMMPKPEDLLSEPNGISLIKLLETLNNRLRILKDNDHTIGHVWLWNVDSLESLKQVFNDKIIPLLQEFFYNDYEKLGLLLGDKFVEVDFVADTNMFATFAEGAGMRNQYTNKKVYKITVPDKWTAEAFKSIYEKSNLGQ